jgi:hypothetical protein
MNGLEQRITRVHIVPEGEPIFHEGGYSVEIDDEASGEFIVVRSQTGGDGKISLDARDWPALREAIDRMVGECRA